MKEKGIKYALGAFLVMFIADFISTLINGELVKHLEANPLYQYLGLGGLAILNLGVAAVFYYGYKYTSSNHTRHAFIFTFTLVSILRIFVVYNNIQRYLNPITIEAAAAIPQTVKTAYYVQAVIMPILLTWSVGMISFWLFQKDHEIKKNA